MENNGFLRAVTKEKQGKVPFFLSEPGNTESGAGEDRPENNSQEDIPLPAYPGLFAWLKIALLVLLFLEGITLMGTGFKAIGKPFVDQLMAVTSNPIVALMIGVLSTSIIQSSSTTTSIVVGMVAAGTLNVRLAIPIVMGANVGTTITNLLVALGSMGRKEEFRRAFAAATIHDYFNLCAVGILLPFELATGYLENISRIVAAWIGASQGAKIKGPAEILLKPPAKELLHGLEYIGFSSALAGSLLAVIGILFIGFSLFLLVKSLRSLVIHRMESFFERFVGRNWVQAMIVGLVITVLVQSSSITTSLLVPMAGAGLLTLEQVYPVTLGANVGTTVTALLASLAAPALHPVIKNALRISAGAP